MLESTGDAVGTVGFVSDGHGRNLADGVPSFLLWRLGELLATSAGKTFDGRAAEGDGTANDITHDVILYVM